MKQLNIPHLPALASGMSIERLSEALETLDKNNLDCVSWPRYNYRPEVKFVIAHNQDCLFLKFYVKEDTIRAVHRQTNDPVHKDSCVEFFIAFSGDEKYYNFEFNCAGTCHAGYGMDRKGREILPEHYIKKIKTLPVIKPSRDNTGKIYWQLTLQLPKEVFCKNEIKNFTGLKGKTNFFKCGDDLPRPHFLSWSRIEAEEPNFHLPEFFGETEFA